MRKLFDFIRSRRTGVKRLLALAAVAIVAIPAYAAQLHWHDIRRGVNTLYSRTIQLYDSTNTYKLTLSAGTLAADRTLTLTDPGASGSYVLSTLTTNAPDAANSVWGASNGLVMEGATANANEGTLSPADVTADRSWVLPDGPGTVMLSSLATNAVDAANAVTGASNALVFEGATADGFETSITSTDPTADNSIVVPNAGGAILLSAGGVADSANAISGGTGTFIAEGATADAFETTISFVDPLADATFTIPAVTGAAMISTLATNAPDLANSITGASNALVFEGATADAFEISVQPGDATADVTQTIPAVAGTHMIAFAAGSDEVANAATSKAVTVTGAMTSDIAIVTLKEVATNAISLRAAIMTADTLTVHVTGDPGASGVDFDYVILRD